MNKIIITGLSSLLLVSACNREIPNPASYPARPAILAAPQNLTIEVWDRQLQLTWQMRDSSDVAEYQVFRSDTSAGPFNLYDSVAVKAYIDSNLQNGRKYFYRMAVVDSAGRTGELSSIASGIPNTFSLIINNGQINTTTRSVTLTIVAPGGTPLMMLSNDNDFSDSQWEPIANTRQWTLDQGAGNRTVFAMFRDGDGNMTANAVSDDIFLDVLPYQYSISVNSGALLARSRNVTLNISAPAGTSYMKISVDPSFAGAFWEAFAASKSWFISPEAAANGDTVVFHIRFRDQQQDSVAVEALDSIRLACADPVEVFPVYQQVDEYRAVTLRWEQTQSGDFQAYRIYRSLGSNAVDTLVNSITASATTSNIDSLHLVALPDTVTRQLYYMVRFISQFADSSDSYTIMVGISNLQPPAVSCFISGVRYTTDTTSGTTDLTANLGWSRSGIANFSHYVIYENTGPNSGTSHAISYVYDRGTLTYGINKSDVDTLATYYYWLKVFDVGGQSSQFSQPDSIRH